MGDSRALIAVGLQSLLMTGIRSYGTNSAVGTLTHRVLATAASLDYVLMLATDTAGTRIPPDDARRAIHDGFARAVDEGLGLLQVIVRIDDAEARSFVRAGLRTLRSAVEAEKLGDDDRAFALIVLTSDSQR